MLRTGVALARLVAAVLLLAEGLFAASFYASNGPRSRPNPSGDLAPPASGAVTIIALSDLKARSGVLLRAYEDAAASKADAIVVGGDLVMMNSDLDYRYASRLLALAPPGVPAFLAIGNHELWGRENDPSPERYERWFGPTQAWFRTKGVLFVAIDTSDYFFPQTRADAARAILAAERPRSSACVLVSHILPQAVTASEGKHGKEKELDPPDSKRILDLVDGFSVDLLLGGHFHGYAHEKRGEATLLLTGGGGATLDGPDEFHHYLKVELTPKAVKHTVVRDVSPHGLEWIRYQLLRYAVFILGGLAALLVVTSIAARRPGAPISPSERSESRGSLRSLGENGADAP